MAWEKDGGWCDGAGSMNTTDEVANIAAEAVEVFRLREGQELLKLFVEGQGSMSLPCFAVGPGLKMEAFVSNGDCRSQTGVGCRVSPGGEDPCNRRKLCGAL